jgi:hypothetical protein
MFGRRQRREERLYWEGFRDALVRGTRNPGRGEVGPAIADRPRYPQGFEDGKQAAHRIHRDALVTEVSRLSLKPGDKLVMKVRNLSEDAIEAITNQIKPRFPDNEILVCGGDTDLSVVEQRPVIVQTILDGKVVAEAAARAAADEAALA